MQFAHHIEKNAAQAQLYQQLPFGSNLFSSLVNITRRFQRQVLIINQSPSGISLPFWLLIFLTEILASISDFSNLRHYYGCSESLKHRYHTLVAPCFISSQINQASLFLFANQTFHKATNDQWYIFLEAFWSGKLNLFQILLSFQ